MSGVTGGSGRLVWEVIPEEWYCKANTLGHGWITSSIHNPSLLLIVQSTLTTTRRSRYPCQIILLMTEIDCECFILVLLTLVSTESLVVGQYIVPTHPIHTPSSSPTLFGVGTSQYPSFVSYVLFLNALFPSVFLQS